MKRLTLCCFLLLAALSGAAHTRQDTLRGSNGRGRDWWDVRYYTLEIAIDTVTRSVEGFNEIGFSYKAGHTDSMQIDLQDGLLIDSAIVFEYRGNVGRQTKVKQIAHDGNVWWLDLPLKFQDIADKHDPALQIFYHGKPRNAINPPWDGGFIWTKDSIGKPWIAVACQGLGASSWWPCKDYQGDEPDSGMSITISIIEGLTEVTNGRFSSGYWAPHGKRVQNDYKVRNPINTYSTTFYIGDYAHWHDTLHGEGGVLDLDFYPLKYNEAKARQHWAVTKDMLRCFEYWMGPYPFYEDGYKLVEAPYLGMEHQSAVAYGNQYKMGYLGRDRSKTGVGLSFDFIIIHESGHEWFGNSITARDIADNWLHEGFTTYTEALFAEWIRGRDSAFAYTTGEWGNIKNDRPVIGDYGVNDDGSSDKYDKGSAVVHMIRMMLHDDQQFRALLRGLNRDFYHKIVTTGEVEDYIGKAVGRDLKPFFNQYLRHAALPVVHAKQHGDNVTLDLIGYDESFKLPVYDAAGTFVCELSRKPVRIPVKSLPALRNYLVTYVPENGTIPLNAR